jgi:hypothetical protein
MYSNDSEDEMTKVDKDKIQTEATTSSEEVIVGLFAQVAKHTLSMPEAEKKLHAHFDGLPEDKQVEARGKARTWGRFLVTIAEAFQAELTIAGAKQD